MASNSFKVKNSINIEPKTSPTLDTAGDIGYNSTAGEFEIRDASATRSLVTDDGTQTLTNKTISGNIATNLISGAATVTLPTTTSTLATLALSETLTNKSIDADTNTITNIENADIKVGAAIDASKIADGSVSNTEFQYLNGVTSAIQTQLNAITAASDQSYEITNLSISTSVAANALTIAIKDKAGSDPSAGSPVYVGMRSSTLTSGVYNQRSITSALSITISSGSTLGQTSGQPACIWVYLIDNAGTLELAVSGSLFHENQVVSTTAEGGAGASDSNSIIYSTSARLNVPIRLIGKIINTQTTAGTWTSAGTSLHVGNYGSLIGNKGPSVQVLTSGSSASYYLPACCLKIKVRAVGGGGGGGGGQGGGSGGTGGTTSFGSYTAIGGTGAPPGQGSTGTGNVAGGTGGAGTADYRVAGSYGGDGGTGTAAMPGFGTGGGTPLGQGAPGVTTGAGINGTANTGAGGSGGFGISNGGGGGGGEYFEVTILNPATTYTYTIGAGGTAGTAGTAAGGTGGSGVIIVEEYYN